MPPLPAHIVRFGPFQLDLRAAELHHNGSRTKLPEQPFQVLVALLEHPGDVVTREELRQRLWGSDTFVDFEQGLNTAVKRLREVLGDSAEKPQYIETIPRHGYRLMVAVEKPEATVSAIPKASARRRKIWLVALAVMVVAVASGIVWRLLVPPVRIESLAVLPLENLSGNPDEEYFADGMTEQLITELGKVRALRVISRQSVMQYKGTNKPVPQIARELHVDAVVEGSAMRVGDKVRITTQLIQANPERHLWSESYQRDLRDILALQSEVAQAITNEVKIKLTPQEQTRLASARPVNPEAYRALLKGRYYHGTGPEEEFKTGTAYIQQAIALDPTYAPAYLYLAGYYKDAAFYGVLPVKEAVPLERAAVEKALELDPTLAGAHALRGDIKFWFDWDWSGAEADLKRTILLNPNNASAHGAYGSFLNQMGRSGEALREFQKQQELDPLNSLGWGLGVALFYARRYDESIAQLNKVLEKNPDFVLPKAAIGWNYAQKRMYPEAVAVCRSAISSAPEDQIVLGGCGWVYARAGRRQDALALLDRLKKLSPRLHLDPYLVALLYDGLGDDDRTLEWLERAYRERSPQMAFLKIEFWSDSLRAQPRFQDLLRRMNFPEQ
jgi:TolB-like protein/DNA-binding winged helix-turn-helix (wHTH) protein/Flp pilus assembly protein TadD